MNRRRGWSTALWLSTVMSLVALPGVDATASTARPCGLLAGNGAYRLGDWDSSAFEVRDQASIVWYPLHGNPRRATLHVVNDPERWPYVTVTIDRTTYLVTQGDRNEAGLVPVPTGFTTPRIPGYLRWFRDGPLRDDLVNRFAPVSAALPVTQGTVCAPHDPASL